MSSFEFPSHQPAESPNVNLPLPEEPDDDWCAMFNEGYGRRGKRTVVTAYAYMAEAPRTQLCMPQTAVRSMIDATPEEVPENGLALDGEVLGARIVPIWDDYSEEYERVLHIVMRDVYNVETDEEIAPGSSEVWIPMTENGEELLMY